MDVDRLPVLARDGGWDGLKISFPEGTRAGTPFTGKATFQVKDGAEERAGSESADPGPTERSGTLPLWAALGSGFGLTTTPENRRTSAVPERAGKGEGMNERFDYRVRVWLWGSRDVCVSR